MARFSAYSTRHLVLLFLVFVMYVLSISRECNNVSMHTSTGCRATLKCCKLEVDTSVQVL